MKTKTLLKMKMPTLFRSLLFMLVAFTELSMSFSAVILRSTDVGVNASVGVGDDVC